MDNIVVQILLAIGGLIGAGLAIFLIIRLFLSVVITRVLSFGCSIAAIVIAFFLYPIAAEGWSFSDGFTLQWVAALLTFLAWVFCFGPNILDVEWDGDVLVDIDIFGHVEISPSENSIFFILMGLGLPVVAVGYFLLGPEMPEVFFILPGITTLVTAITVFFYARDN